MIRILFVIDTLEVGGTEVSLLSLLSRIDRGEFDPIVCSIYPGEALRLKLDELGVRVIPLNTSGRYAFPSAIRQVTQLIQELQPDLVHTALFRANQVGRRAAKRCGVPVVSSFVNVPYEPERFLDDPAAGGLTARLKVLALRAIDAWTSRSVDRFHSVSESVAASNCRRLGIDRSRVEVIERGRTLDLPVESRAELRERLETELGIPRDSLLVVSVGRLIPQKGQRYLIDAAARLQLGGRDVRVLIAGEGRLREQLESQIRDLGLEGNVLLPGVRRDVPALLACCDLFVFPSVYEGLPGALVEAMLAGCSIIASDIPMHTDLIDDGVNGRVFPTRQVDRLAEIMSDSLVDLDRGRSLGARAQQQARVRHDMDRIVRKTATMYRNIVAQSR